MHQLKLNYYFMFVQNQPMHTSHSSCLLQSDIAQGDAAIDMNSVKDLGYQHDEAVLI